MWMKSSFFLVFLLFSCSPIAAVNWPVQQYPYGCKWMPMEPACISSIEVGFKYSGQFSACKQSLNNYVAFQEAFYDCTAKELNDVFQKLSKNISITYNCLSQYKDDKNEVINCPNVEIPKFDKAYIVRGLEYDLGVPYCVKNFRHRQMTEFFLDDCKADVDEFNSDGKYISSYSSARKQYKEFMGNLHDEIQNNIDNAIRKFNCHAENQDFCL